MSFLGLLLVAVGVSADAFAVALGKGLHLKTFDLRHAVAIAVAFGGFQGLMPVATSVDALAVGISFAFLDVSIWRAAVLIGVCTCLLSFVGVLLGRRVGARFGAPPRSPGASSSS